MALLVTTFISKGMLHLVFMRAHFLNVDLTKTTSIISVVR
jgi:hypothetical protein